MHKGRVAKLADAPALGAGSARSGGSSPLPPTNLNAERRFFVAGRKLWESFREDLNDGGSERLVKREAESVPSLKFYVQF